MVWCDSTNMCRISIKDIERSMFVKCADFKIWALYYFNLCNLQLSESITNSDDKIYMNKIFTYIL